MQLITKFYSITPESFVQHSVFFRLEVNLSHGQDDLLYTSVLLRTRFLDCEFAAVLWKAEEGDPDLQA